MKAKDLRPEEIFTFSEGTFTLKGREVVIHSLHAFAQFRKDLIDSTNLEHARNTLSNFGYFQGQADASILIDNFKWDNKIELIKAGCRLHSFEGIAKDIIHNISFDESSGKFYMEISWHDSKEAEEHLFTIGKSTQPVCWILAGYFSGFASFALNKEIYFIEQSCKAQGNNVCHALGQDKNSWGKGINLYPYSFKPYEIKLKIEKLSNQLKKKGGPFKKIRKGN